MATSRDACPSAWVAWRSLEERLKREVIVIDGGTGTLLEAKGADMDHLGWSCATQLNQPELVQEVHEDFLRAGANLVICNTYAVNRNVMSKAGFGDATLIALRKGVNLCRAAVERVDPTALVAGSLSTHPPAMPEGGAQSPSDLIPWPPEDEELAGYVEAATTLALSGVDLLFLEMMKDMVHAPRAIYAARHCGLPVFLGVSTRVLQDGRLVLFGTGADEIPFTREWVKDMINQVGDNLVGVNVMHTNFSAMGPTLAIVRDVWPGPLGAYPDHGQFCMPLWMFKPIEFPDAQRQVKTWIDDYGVSLVGGCCGLKDDFIRAVREVVDEVNKSKS